MTPAQQQTADRIRDVAEIFRALRDARGALEAVTHGYRPNADERAAAQSALDTLKRIEERDP